MSSNQLPVLTLDIDEEKIRQLNEICDKFKSGFAIGPGGFPTTVPVADKPNPGNNNPPGNPGHGNNDATGFNKFLKNLNKEAQGTLKTFGLINKTLGATTNALKGLFTTTLSWGAKVAALSVAGPFGYNMMASSVSETARTSQGLNVSTGQMQAANNVYGTRISGASDILQSLAAAENNPQHPMYAGLINMGLNPQDGAAANMPKFMTGVTSLLNQYKGTGVSQAILKSHGLDGAVDVVTANQLLKNSDSIPLFNQQFADQSQQLDRDMGRGTEAGMQNVSASFSHNFDQLSNSFLKAVSKLNGPITQLSDNLTAGIKKFISGPNGAAVFDSIASGLETLAKWLGSDSFQADLALFSKAIENVVIAIGNAIKWIASFDPSGTGTGREDADPALVKFGDKYMGGKLPGANPWTNKYTGIFTEEEARKKFQMPDALKEDIQGFVAQANNAAGLPAGMMSAIAEKESSWNPLAINKKSGAAGLFQFMPDTAKGYGLEGDDVYDPVKATVAAAKYLQDNMARYDGDIAKSLTQYNGGRIDKEGNLSLVEETVNYLLKTLPQIDGGTEQHPDIMRQLQEAQKSLAANPDEKARVSIKLDINQVPGSDISAQVKGNYIPPR